MHCSSSEWYKKGTLLPIILYARIDGTYVGCHRYDKPALNIILAQNFGLKTSLGQKQVTGPLAAIVQHSQGIHSVKHIPHCDNSTVVALATGIKGCEI